MFNVVHETGKTMKFVASLVLLFVLSVPCLSQSSKWYVFGGTSYWGESSEAFVNDGRGIRLGVGTQTSERIGIELLWDSAPGFGSVLEITSTVIDVDTRLTIVEREEFSPTRYVSLLGTLAVPATKNLSYLFKGGVGTSGVDFKEYERTTITSSIASDIVVSEETLDISKRNSGAIVSGGLLYRTSGKLSYELSTTRHFGDTKSWSINAVMRYRF